MYDLIGISGKKQHGKDTVAKIIQYHTSKQPYDITIEEFLEEEWSWLSKGENTTWEIKKYADKLKDIVCLLIGCTREQLEDNDFKEKELGEEWWYYRTTCSGDYHTEVKLFNELQECTDFIYNDKYLWSEPLLIKTTPRLLLQLLGTECGRQILHPNIWLNALFSDYRPIGGKMVVPNFPKDYTSGRYDFAKWLVTDVRFGNEVDEIRKKGGVVIRVNRKTGNPLIGNDTHAVTDHQHPSETALDDYEKFDYIIDNDGNLDDLERKVLEMLDKFGIEYRK